MKKSTLLKLIIITLAIIAVSPIAYVFLRAPSSRIAALAEIELQSTVSPIDGLFKDYQSWPYSNKLKPNQTMMQMLEMMVTSRIYKKQSFASASQYIDLNGDGLSDFLYFYYAPPFDPTTGNLTGSGRKDCYSKGARGYMVLKNNGDYTFEQAYKCMWQSGDTVNNFYGDCAALEPPYEDDFYTCGISCPFYIDFGSYSFHPVFFHDYKKWQSGPLKTNDKTRDLLDALSTVVSPFSNTTEEKPNYEIGSQFVDLNGDSLVDFLLRQSEGNISGQYDSDCDHNNSSSTKHGFSEYVIFINQGNFQVKPVYKCDIEGIEGIGGMKTYYYGDCAAL